MSETVGGNTAAPQATTNVATTNTTTTTTPAQTAPKGGAETIEQVIADGKAQDAKTQTKTEPASTKKKIKAKVYGKDVDYEIDTADEKALASLAAKALGAEKAFEEGAMTKKQMQQLVNALQSKDSIWQLLADAGHNVDDLVGEFVERKLAENEKSPEQKEMERIQKELETERQARKKMEEEKSFAEKQQKMASYSQKLQQDIMDAFTEVKGVVQSPYTLKRLASTMHAFAEKGYEISPKDALNVMKATDRAELQEMMSKMEPEELEDFLGEENNKRLRARRLAKQREIKAASQIKASGVSEIEKQISQQQQPKMSAKDFFKKLS